MRYWIFPRGLFIIGAPCICRRPVCVSHQRFTWVNESTCAWSTKRTSCAAAALHCWHCSSHWCCCCCCGWCWSMFITDDCSGPWHSDDHQLSTQSTPAASRLNYHSLQVCLTVWYGSGHDPTCLCGSLSLVSCHIVSKKHVLVSVVVLVVDLLH